MKIAHSSAKMYVCLCFCAFLALIFCFAWNIARPAKGPDYFTDAAQAAGLLTDFVYFDGEAADDWAGFSAAVLDFNNDGYEDLAISAISEATAGAEIGAVYILYGDGGMWTSMSLADADVKITGAEKNDGVDRAYLGKWVRTGDVDGDGIDDIFFGAEQADGAGLTQNGVSYLVYGGQALSGTYSVSDIGGDIDGASFIGSIKVEQSGARLSLGDFNGDTYDDLLISGLYYDSEGLLERGSVYLIFGKAVRFSGTYLLADVGGAIDGVQFIGTAAGDRLGKALSFVGDVDNDGYDDIVLGARFAHYAGVADVGISYLIYGGQSINSPMDVINVGGSVIGAKFYGEAANDTSATEISGGYYNEDAYGDFSIYAQLADNGAIANVGANYLIYGSSTRFTGENSLSGVGSTIPGLKFIGEGASDRFGSYFTSADINNDGLNEYFISAHLHDNGGAIADNYGAVYLIYRDQVLTSPIFASTIGSTVDGVKIVGEQLGGQFGFDVQNAGDLNGDQYEEILAGAYLVDVGPHTDAGRMYLGYFYIDADLDGLPGTAGIFKGTDRDDNDPTVLDSWHPTVADVGGVQATDGSNTVSIQFTVDDPDQDETCSARVEYSIDGGVIWEKATLSEAESDTVATFGTPNVENDNTYQIGNASGYITTSSGANTVTAIWQAGIDAPNTEVSNAQLRITPFDNTAPGTPVVSNDFVVDTKAPSGLAKLTRGTVSWNSLTPAWDVVTDANFSDYELWYGYVQEDVDTQSGTAILWDDTSDANLANITTGASLIPNLASLTNYYVKLFAIDAFGNVSTLDSVEMPTIKKSESIVTASPGGTIIAHGNIESFLITQARFPESSTIQEETSTTFFWTSTGRVPFINLFYSLDDGITYKKIVGPTIATGSYNWTTPKTLDGTAIIFKLEATDLDIILDTEIRKKALGVIRPSIGYSPITGHRQEITEVFPGDMIRSDSFKEIYLVTDTYERCVFLNEETYFTWSDSFNDIKVVSDATLASLPLIGRVLPKPGVILVKFQFSPKVYAIEENPDDQHRPYFRWITSEQAATQIFGSDWAQYIMDIPFDGLKLFSIGEDISSLVDYTPHMNMMKKRILLHN